MFLWIYFYEISGSKYSKFLFCQQKSSHSDISNLQIYRPTENSKPIPENANSDGKSVPNSSKLIKIYEKHIYCKTIL